MKNLIYCLLLGILLNACTQNKISPTEENQNQSLLGEWKWVKSSGGIAGFSYTPEDAGYNKYLQFTDNQQYTIYKNQEIERSGQFSIQKIKSIYNQKMVDAIQLDDNNTLLIIEKLNQDTLAVADNYVDGFGSIYIRVKK